MAAERRATVKKEDVNPYYTSFAESKLGQGLRRLQRKTPGQDFALDALEQIKQANVQGGIPRAVGQTIASAATLPLATAVDVVHPLVDTARGVYEGLTGYTDPTPAVTPTVTPAGVDTGRAHGPSLVPFTPGAELAGAAPVSEGLRFSNVADAERYERLGLQGMLRSPSPNIANVLMRDPATGERMVRESISGGAGPPALREPINPALWTGTLEQLQEANRANEEYNAQLMAGWTGRDAQWAAQEGGIPLQQAQAGLAEVRAEAVPGTVAATQEQQAAQAELNRALAAKASLLPVPEQVLAGERGMEQPVRRTKFYDIEAKEMLDVGGIRKRNAAAQALAAELTSKQRTKALEYIKAHPEEDKLSVLERIKAGEL